MSFQKLKSVAEHTVSGHSGFDHIKASAVQVNRIGIRIAQSTVCRENVFNESNYLNIQGAWQGRESAFSISGSEQDKVPALTAKLLADLKKQSPNKEYRAPKTSAGSFKWDIAKEAFEDIYGPHNIYPVIEKYAAKVRSRGFRLTGYIECEETKAQHFMSSNMDLSTHDHGMSFSVTVDNEKTGATGATHRGLVRTTKHEFDRIFGEAVEEALLNASSGNEPGEIEPGDYTVVLHPACVNDLIVTNLMYGMFDKRKIDETRTYLAKAKDTLTFPKGLFLHQELSVDRPGLTYRDSPFNQDGVECDSVRLIDNGRIVDTHVSRYWAEQSGSKESFSSFNGPTIVLGTTADSNLAGRFETTNDLIAGTERGIYVCNTWYLRMVTEMEGIITGMTRDGLYEIRDGKLTRPLKNMRWHENPFRVLSAVDAVTDQGTTFGRSRLAGKGRLPLAWIPAVRAKNFHFSSVTKF
jgi:predicted Zn-dependent protease